MKITMQPWFRWLPRLRRQRPWQFWMTTPARPATPPPVPDDDLLRDLRTRLSAMERDAQAELQQRLRELGTTPGAPVDLAVAGRLSGDRNLARALALSIIAPSQPAPPPMPRSTIHFQRSHQQREPWSRVEETDRPSPDVRPTELPPLPIADSDKRSDDTENHGLRFGPPILPPQAPSQAHAHSPGNPAPQGRIPMQIS